MIGTSNDHTDTTTFSSTTQTAKREKKTHEKKSEPVHNLRCEFLFFDISFQFRRESFSNARRNATADRQQRDKRLQTIQTIFLTMDNPHSSCGSTATQQYPDTTNPASVSILHTRCTYITLSIQRNVLSLSSTDTLSLLLYLPSLRRLKLFMRYCCIFYFYILNCIVLS